MRNISIFICTVLICQANLSTAFLWTLFNGIFGGGQPIQPSIYAPMGQNNQTNQTNQSNLSPLQMAQMQAQGWPTMSFNYPTTGIAGAFDDLARGVGGFGAGATLGVASLVTGVLQAFNSLLGVLGPGSSQYGAMLPQNNTNATTKGDKSSKGDQSNDAPADG
ncbi:uncharacterized protein LOC116340291 [Contarinia nasturtii]|uniref:uncharacterized protein LOC116340291 n=1 Tax=Contarinia nasturtii TaxID=265458 RepID=UPI0012D44859|nr:uncharacterized protein LOC116340291 [Contarinia nasturtii]